jgi:5-bromo-4-chloroindolyl phosphate hydrolysis protein
MTGREERVARNEATSRQINEGLEEAHQGTPPTEYVRMVCECGRNECDRVLAITLSEYQQIRREPIRFAVARDHVASDVEEVVEETDRFAVVLKREGTPADVASETEPRS